MEITLITLFVPLISGLIYCTEQTTDLLTGYRLAHEM